MTIYITCLTESKWIFLRIALECVPLMFMLKMDTNWYALYVDSGNTMMIMATVKVAVEVVRTEMDEPLM